MGIEGNPRAARRISTHADKKKTVSCGVGINFCARWRRRFLRTADAKVLEMEDDSPAADRLDSIADFYEGARDESDRLMRALESWDYDQYRHLRLHDPELYRLICHQVGEEIEILLGKGSVRLGHHQRQIELTWNGDAEDLVDLVLEGARFVTDP
jgi:hypothetical protein